MAKSKKDTPTPTKAHAAKIRNARQWNHRLKPQAPSSRNYDSNHQTPKGILQSFRIQTTSAKTYSYDQKEPISNNESVNTEAAENLQKELYWTRVDIKIITKFQYKSEKIAWKYLNL